VRPPTYIDLFAGCGGLSLGMQAAGWCLQLAIEGHADAFATLRENLIERRGSNVSWAPGIPCEAIEIGELLSSYGDGLRALSGQVDAIVGGPPCQGFSLNGKRDGDDPRNQLVHRYLEMVGILGPSLVLLENVRGFSKVIGHSFAAEVNHDAPQDTGGA